MINKKDKLVAYSREHANQLNVLSQKKEFASLISLFRLEEHNIMTLIAKLDPTDDKVAVKLALYRGRIEELRILISVFDRVKKESRDEESD